MTTLTELRTHRQHLEHAAQFWRDVLAGLHGNFATTTVTDGMLAEIERLVRENIELREGGSTERCRTCEKLEHTWKKIAEGRAGA